MNIIEITPPKQLNFTLPGDMHRVITLTNLTLHSLFVTILKSHPTEISLEHQSFLMQAFEQKKVIVALNWSQEGANLSVGMLRVCYEDVEDQMQDHELRKLILSEKGKGYFEDLTINLSLDAKSLQFTNYKQVQKQQEISWQQCSSQISKKYYLMQRVSHLWQTTQKQNMINTNNFLKNQILSFLQHLPQVLSIEPCQQQSSFLVQFSSEKTDNCALVQFVADQQVYVYSIRRIVGYGRPQQLPTLISLEENFQKKEIYQQKNMKIVESEPPVQKIHHSPMKPSIPPASESNTIQKQQLKKQMVKQSFIHRRQTQKVKSRRKNKSEEKIIENSEDEEDEAELFKEQVRELKKYQVQENRKTFIPEFIDKKNGKQEAEVKYRQTDIEVTEKVLNVLVQSKEEYTQIYVILSDCIRCFVLEDPLQKKMIKFEAIYKENVNMPTPVVKYKDQLIFGNQTSLFWVHLISGNSQWKYVQRKYIYALAVIQQLSLVAVGGKNFSKLSYFGKETSRSNIKLYSCSFADKHDHLFTYDILGNNMGNVMNMDYIVVPPHNMKLLLVHTLNAEGKSHFHFLRVKAFNKIQVYGQMDLEELGIIRLLKFKFNPQSSRIICMEALGDTEMDGFKNLKLKCQYQKVQVSTEGLKFPLKQYISFHMGGSSFGKSAQWMSLVDHNGSNFHLYDFENRTTANFEHGKGDIRQVFSVSNQKFIVICTDHSIRIRERVEVKE